MCNLQSAKNCASVGTSLATVHARAQEMGKKNPGMSTRFSVMLTGGVLFRDLNKCDFLGIFKFFTCGGVDTCKRPSSGVPVKLTIAR
jgi:hypothetical protein